MSPTGHPPQPAAIQATEWYHTIELAPGVLTPGWFDTRQVSGRVPMPASLEGQRCLDVGTFDGFWAFEMERRGAAEVMAIDLLRAEDWDWPAMSAPEVIETLAARKRGGNGFEVARQALGSVVERRELSAYDLDPAEVGQFDFVYLGSLLLHLRDPVRALERVRAVCRGRLLVVDNHQPLLTALFGRMPVARLDGSGRPWWWQGNAACIKRMVEAAGFAVEHGPVRLRMPAGAGQKRPALRLRTLRTSAGRTDLRNALFGDPHVALLARPETVPR